MKKIMYHATSTDPIFAYVGGEKHSYNTDKQWLLDNYGSFIDADKLVIEELDYNDWILQQVPEEFRSTLSYMAYECGHSSGEAEVQMLLESLINDLAPVIEKYTKRITGQ